jgi:hypothetical protein
MRVSLTGRQLAGSPAKNYREDAMNVVAKVSESKRSIAS